MSALALLFASAAAWAGPGEGYLGVYEMQFTPSVSKGVSRPDSDWECNAYQKVEYQKVVFDYSGQWEQRQKTVQANDLKASLRDAPLSKFVIQRNSYDVTSRYWMKFGEKCSRTETVMVDVPEKSHEQCDNKGENCEKIVDSPAHQEPKTETYEGKQEWACQINYIPDVPGQRGYTHCVADKSSGDPGFSSYFQSLREHTSVDASTTLKEARRNYAPGSTCPPNARSKSVLHVDQGLGKHAGESSFLLFVRINAPGVPQREIQLRGDENGDFAHDIAICPPVQEATVSVRGLEEDLIWDDSYTSDGRAFDKGGAPVSVTVSRNGPTATAKLTRKNGMISRYFERHHWLKGVFTPSTSFVRVNLRQFDEEPVAAMTDGLGELNRAPGTPAASKASSRDIFTPSSLDPSWKGFGGGGGFGGAGAGR